MSPNTFRTPTNKGGKCVEHQSSSYEGVDEAASIDKSLKIHQVNDRNPQKAITTLAAPMEVEGNKLTYIQCKNAT